MNDTLQIAFREGVRLDDTRWVEKLVVSCQGAALVVMDPFVGLHGQNENDQVELGPVLRAIQQLITRTGATVLLLHHTRKESSWEKGGMANASSADARGSGALAGNVDSIICVRGVPDQQRVPGQVRFIIENTESQIAAPFERRTAVVKLTGEADAFSWQEGTPESKAESAEELLERMLPVIPTDETSPLSRVDIRTAMRVKKERLTDAIALGLQRGLLAEGRRGALYRIVRRDLDPVLDPQK